jgi:ankyrin repeat protein
MGQWLLVCRSITKLLLDRGAFVDLPKRDGATALHIAAEKGHASIGLLLITHGAKVNKVWCYGDMHHWARCGLLASIGML